MKRGKISLTNLYRKYTTAKNSVERVGYGTLYRMTGGRKEISEYSLDMMCYISGVDSLRRADMKYSELLVQDRAKVIQREEQIKFYIPRFKSILDYTAYIYGMKLEIEQETSFYKYRFKLNDNYIISGVLLLDAPDFYGGLHQGLRRLKIELEFLMGRLTNQNIYGLELYNFENDLLQLLQQMNCTLGTGQSN